MVEGFNNSAKALAARATIGTAGVQIRLAGGDPGNAGGSNILSPGTGGYQHENVDNGDISISTAGVIQFPTSKVAFGNPSANWSAAPTWAAIWTREGTPRHVCNVDITDIAIPGSAKCGFHPGKWIQPYAYAVRGGRNGISKFRFRSRIFSS